MSKIPCTTCEQPFTPVMLSEAGNCPKCDADKAQMERELARKRTAPRKLLAGEPEQRRKLFAQAVAHDEEEEELKQKLLHKQMKIAQDFQAKVERFQDLQPALEARYNAAVEAEQASLDERAERRRQARDARKELALRELARRHLLPYTKYLMPGYKAGWVHKDICQRLERFRRQVAAGESPRLMLLMPPRHGKSLLATQKYPSWHLGHHPDHEFMVASYSASLANKFSKVTRAILRDEAYHNLFDTRLDEDDAPVEGWSTLGGGAYFPTGVGGPATGRGAHVLVIDDPVKNREEAESETVRQSIKDWYTSTAYTRLAPGGGVLIIQTCWHDDDLQGWLQTLSRSGEGDEFEVISYPAIATEDERHRKVGEALHPERYPLEALERIKRAIGPRDWNALYQQNPIPDSGDFFKAGDLRFYKNQDRPPLEDLAIYAAADFAIGEKQQNDSTVIYVAGIDRDMNLWLLDRYKGKWGTMDIMKNLCLAHRTWQPEVFGGERGHIEQTLAPVLNEYKYKPEYNAPGLYLRPLKPGRADKVARARIIQGMVEMHKVYVPEDAPWWPDAASEILRFPLGKHDDDPDALAWLGKMIEMFTPVPAPREERKKSWRDNLSKYVKSDSRSGARTAMSA